MLVHMLSSSLPLSLSLLLLLVCLPGPIIAKNFCGSILADCFVLTPHNNQLRHCQRNTHSSRIPPPPVSPLGGILPGLCRELPPVSRPPRTLALSTPGCVFVVGRQQSLIKSSGVPRGPVPTAGSTGKEVGNNG